MKSLVILCLFVVALEMSNASPSGRGCIYILGRCASECEEGTHAYTTGCGYLTPEATCENPNPTEDTSGHICDYSACYCDAPTVRDTKTKKCVPIDECT